MISSNIARKNEERLFWLGGLCALIYVFAFPYSYYLGKYYAIPLLSLSKISDVTYAAAAIFVGSFAFLFLFYYGAVMLSLRQMPARSVVFIIVFAFVFSLPLILTYPIGAADIFGYISHGRLQAIYGLNPFVFPPSAVPTDPFLAYNAWPDETSTYGPVWGLIGTGLAALGGNDLWLNLLLFKGTVVLFFLGSAYLIYLILRKTTPNYALSGTVLFAWNPLVLFEIAANGHNDSVLIFFLLLSFLFVSRGKAIAGTAIMTLSFLTKFVTAPLLVLLIFFQVNRALSLKDKVVALGFGIITSITVIVIFYAPFWQGFDSIGFLKRTDLFTSSIAALGRQMLSPVIGDDLARSIMRSSAIGLFSFLFFILLSKVGKRFEGCLLSAYETMFFYLVIATLWFQPWYVTWLVALGALIERREIRMRTVLFSFCALLSYLAWQFILLWNWGTMDWLEINLIAVTLIFAAPLGYSAWQLARRRVYRDAHIKEEQV